jgi:hypothetical protein
VPDLVRQVKTGIAWGILSLLFQAVGYVAIVFDLIQRAGGPLIVEFHVATVVWVVAYVGYRASYSRMGAILDKVNAQ